MIETEAWVLAAGTEDAQEEGGRKGERRPAGAPGELKLESYAFPALADDEALIEPIYGCWEGNMSHALARSPIDVCKARGEPRVVLGNAGVVRVRQTGRGVKNVREGDFCMFFGTGEYDEHRYMLFAHAYDARNTVGLLAKRTKVRSINLFKIPEGSRYSLRQWAAFSLRYMTAWSNWRVAYGSLRLQLSESDLPRPHVWGWGGGTTLAELELARHNGCETVMISGSGMHLEEIRRKGITPLNRHELGIIDFDEKAYVKDEAYRARYLAGEKRLLEEVKQRTRSGVSIFVDYIGSPVWRMTSKALARQGVVTTAGWKLGMLTPVNRAIECIARHVHVFTHYARLDEASAAIAFGNERGWMPDEGMPVYSWKNIPDLARDFRENKVDSYFPLFEVNPE